VPLANTNQDEIVRLMVGRDLAGISKPSASGRAQPVVLAVRNLCGGRQYQNISFDLRRGEIVGLSGLVGAGRSEMALGLFGAPLPDSGAVLLDGAAVKICGPQSAMRLGIALVPEDRKQLGLVLGLGVGPNVSLSALTHLSHTGLIDFRAEDSLIGRYIDRFRIKTLREGRMVGEIAHSDATEERIMALGALEHAGSAAEQDRAYRADAGDVFRIQLRAERRYGLDLLGSERDDVGNAVDDHPDHALRDVENDHDGKIVVVRVLEAEFEPHVDDRDDDAPQVDDAFDELGRIRDSANRIAAADLLDFEDVDSVLRVAKPKA
jgi:energy-coupling factor transporter ATP-binding protein EcfA2